MKAVLDKARNRTGIQNSSSKPSSVVADAASLGGLGDGPLDFVIQKSEKNGKKNGAYDSFSVDDLILEDQKPNGSDKNKKPKDFDTISGDIPAANQFCEPMPFTLPKLNKEQMQQLKAGERVQEQARMGREGSGYVVLDVKAPPFVVWECLLDFESYPQLISTVRDVQIFANQNLGTGSVNKEPAGTGSEIPHYGTPSSTRASFVLSKFRLNIAAIHKYTPHPEGDYMEFNLDKSSTNMVLKGAKGIWHTIENPDGREVRDSDWESLCIHVSCVDYENDDWPIIPSAFHDDRATLAYICCAKCRCRGLFPRLLLTTLRIGPCPEQLPG